VFGADIIAGFPTETDEMFENSLGIVEEYGLTNLHVFPFSPREGTPAAKMPQLERGVVKARAARLRAAGVTAYVRYLDSVSGSFQKVLVERPGVGRTEGFTLVSLNGGSAGAIVPVTITGHDQKKLTGVIASALAA
jgi:threonylcarbamoyladenosine tRNA methylthiotransferase MtaB